MTVHAKNAQSVTENIYEEKIKWRKQCSKSMLQSNVIL